ncbi:hypothetical protein [Anoxybacteroides amylolyticum]|uniref:hypothetical protein n=1 Tax=Anoxybacteroides amylolyticum TaxID=294699 RepID=UPI0011E043F6|nr:hypothetical protein [Anoxybacillus amylolyticus]
MSNVSRKFVSNNKAKTDPKKQRIIPRYVSNVAPCVLKKSLTAFTCLALAPTSYSIISYNAAIAS